MIQGQTSLLTETHESFEWPAIGAAGSTGPRPPAPPKLTKPTLKVLGPPDPKIVVVVEHFEDETAPLQGPAGRFFRDELARLIPVERLGFCYHDVVAAEAQPMVEAASWVLISGVQPLRQWRRDLHVRECHGRPFLLKGTLEGTVGFPIWHYVSFYRNLHWRELLRAELDLFVSYIVARHAGQNWYADTPATCVRCRKEFWACDNQGVVYCKAHWRHQGR